MNLGLWALQVLVALLVALTGALKLVVPRQTLATKMHWAKDWSDGRVKLLGLAEVLGAIGLVVPAATNILPVLTPIAALCLAVLMAGAVQTHRRLGEGFLPALVVLLLCLAIAAGRFA
ncbi:MAG: DoxX family protein [Sandaracinaceae bacterium]|nr:DoxX family protein [Sandaracinaceae bacterium]